MGTHSKRGAALAAGITLTITLGALEAGCPPPDEPSPEADAGTTTHVDAGGGADAFMPIGEDAGPAALVDVSIHGSVIFANNFRNQFHPLFRAGVGDGDLNKVKIFARFCEDAACTRPVAVVPTEFEGGDDFYALSTASTSGEGFDKTFTIRRAPAGDFHVQLVGHTRTSEDLGHVGCDAVSSCPSDFDVLMIANADFSIPANADGTVAQPGAASVPLSIHAGSDDDLGRRYLGHVVFDRTGIDAPAPSDPGSLLVALSNEANTYRNRIVHIELADASAHPGAFERGYVLQRGGADFQGDICGIVRGPEALYAIAVGNDGASVFALGLDGAQTRESPIVTIPPADPRNPETYPWPCRGVYGEGTDGTKHLYLVQFKGAGGLDTSRPFPLYDVNLMAGSYATPIADTNLALRAIAFGGGHLYAVDMSWSKDSRDRHIDADRVVTLALDPSGSVTGSSFTTTSFTSNEPCESTGHWPSGAVFSHVGRGQRLLVGHDEGVAVFDPEDLEHPTSLALPSHGRLFTQLEVSADGSRLYALPQCKAINSATTFRLPYGASDEAADTNLVAILDLNGSALAVADTSIDIDGNGTDDDGIDLDFYHLKRFIRARDTTAPIPPVVFTGPQMAVGASVVAVHGSGIQGNGADILSSSGMGQVQEFGLFDLRTGRGIVFGGYVPWTNGLSSGAGREGGIWGYDLVPDREASLGAIVYIPAP